MIQPPNGKQLCGGIGQPVAFPVATGETNALPLKILGISCSPRKGMTTAQAVEAALDAAKGASPRIAVDFIDLGGLKIRGGASLSPEDDFGAVLTKLQDPAVAGLIIGSPSYFRGLSGLCVVFIDRCGSSGGPKLMLEGKPIGAIATGDYRDGGQRTVIEQIETAMQVLKMIPVDRRSSVPAGNPRQAAQANGGRDEFGLTAARHTGLRVAEFVLRLAE